MTAFIKLTALAILFTSCYAGEFRSVGVPAEPIGGLSAPSAIESSFEPSSFPVGSLPSATFSGHGLIGSGIGAEPLGLNIGIGSAGITGAAIGPGPAFGGPVIGPGFGGPVIAPPIGAAGSLPGVGSGFGGDAPPLGPKAPVINEIHGLANNNGAPTQYRVRDEPYQVLREVTHRIPQPVPVPVPRPVHVHVPQPYPVQVPVVRKVPVPVVKIQHVKVDRPVPYPVERIVKIPVEKVIEVPVDHPVPVERIVEVPVVKLIKVPVPIVKSYPVPVIKTLHHKAHVSHGWSKGHGHGWPW